MVQESGFQTRRGINAKRGNGLHDSHRTGQGKSEEGSERISSEG